MTPLPSTDEAWAGEASKGTADAHGKLQQPASKEGKDCDCEEGTLVRAGGYTPQGQPWTFLTWDKGS